MSQFSAPLTGAAPLKAWEEVLGQLPNSYMALDIETSGFSTASDFILSIGHVIVADGVVVDCLEFLLNWFDVDGVDGRELARRIKSSSDYMEKQGKRFHITPQLLQQRGVNPIPVITEYAQLLNQHLAQGGKLVMHNGIFFDWPRLEFHARTWGKVTLSEPRNAIFDTAMLEKASMAASIPNLTNLSIEAWSRRIYAMKLAGVKWDLHNHCATKYNLLSKANSLDPSHQHSALYDAFLTHLLFQEFRTLSRQFVVQEVQRVVLIDPPTVQEVGTGHLLPVSRYGHLG